MKRKNNRSKSKLDHSAFSEIPFEDYLAWGGIWEGGDALASLPVILQHRRHIPSVPPLSPVFLSHLFLIKYCLTWIGILATRQEIWEDLVSFQGCLSIIFKHNQPHGDTGLPVSRQYWFKLLNAAHSSAASVRELWWCVFVWLVDLFKSTKWTVSFHLRVHPSQFTFTNQRKRGRGWKHNTEHSNSTIDEFRRPSWWKTEISDQI